jgi:DNA-binding NarL/FixJ family response regulator
VADTSKTAPAADWETPRILVMLVDPYPLVRSGLRRILENEPDIVVVAEAESASEGIRGAHRVDLDVIVMGMAIDRMNGLNATSAMIEARPEVQILLLSQYSEPHYVRKALDAGAKGCVLWKHAIDADLTCAVRAVAAGKTYLSPELSCTRILAIQTDLSEVDDPYDRLTDREKQVLQLIAQGQSNRQIACMLRLSVNTVAVHRANLMNTLGVHKATELVLFAVRRGLVPSDADSL